MMKPIFFFSQWMWSKAYNAFWKFISQKQHICFFQRLNDRYVPRLILYVFIILNQASFVFTANV